MSLAEASAEFMNKWQIICPLSLMLSIGLVFGMITIRSQHREFINVAARSIGSDLIASSRSSHLVYFGSALQTSLSELKSTRAQVADVLFGDEMPPAGDGMAACRLVLTNDAGKGLIIRLRVADKAGSFQVLGCRTFSE